MGQFVRLQSDISKMENSNNQHYYFITINGNYDDDNDDNQQFKVISWSRFIFLTKSAAIRFVFRK